MHRRFSYPNLENVKKKKKYFENDFFLTTYLNQRIVRITYFYVTSWETLTFQLTCDISMRIKQTDEFLRLDNNIGVIPNKIRS